MSLPKNAANYKRYWDEERETMPQKQQDKVILERMGHNCRCLQQDPVLQEPFRQGN